MRILWYSLGQWFTPAQSGAEVINLKAADDAELAKATAEPYLLFLEPTPYPDFGYDPIQLATRLAAVARSKPTRLVAFVADPTPVPFETQCAFAAQIGIELGVTPTLKRVAVRTRASSRLFDAKKSPEGVGPIDPGPGVDWQRALDAASTGRDAETLPEESIRLVNCYLHSSSRRRLSPTHRRFSPTQRRLLAFAAAGHVSVNAAKVAEALNVAHVTAQRAIKATAADFFDVQGHESAHLVNQLVNRYAWFLRYNEH